MVSRVVKFLLTECRIVDVRGCRERTMGVVVIENGGRVSVLQDEKNPGDR